MADYKVTQINVDGPPNEWKGPKGTVYYIGVMLEGHDKPVSIGKKTPDALKPGDTVYGEIEETDYLLDKWKHGEAPQTSSSSAPNYGTSEANSKDKQITKNMVWKNLLNVYDIPSMTPDSTQWREFWANVELHTEMLVSGNYDRISGSNGTLPTQSTLETQETQSPRSATIHEKLAQSDWPTDEDRQDS